jgi:hypothetical protein
MLIADEFRAHFGEDDLADIDQETAVIYGLDADLKIALFNDAWLRYARQNNAPQSFFDDYGLGASYLDSVVEPLRDFFESRLRQSIADEESWTFDYLCHSPSNYRQYHMEVLPLSGGLGCLVSNAIIVETPHPDDAVDDGIAEGYFSDDKLITQCSHCRRVRHPKQTDRWDWVPRFVQYTPENTSHSICPTCFAYFYPPASIEKER